MSSNLPLIIAQLRLASLSSDPFHRNTADSLSQRYIALDKEMEEIGKLWKSAKDQLHLQHQETKRVSLLYHFHCVITVSSHKAIK
jgi:hypothetical protein